MVIWSVSFFSPDTNKRTDEFGGSVENRARFGLMVMEEIRRRVGDDFIIGMRYAVDEVFASLCGCAVNRGQMDLDALAEGRPQPRLEAEGYTLLRIGDAAGSRDVQAAMFDAMRLCCRL